MKIELSRAQFKAILDGTAHAVEKSGWRPMLAYIQLEVTKERITAVALDGYRAGRVRIMKQSAEEFTCFFKPIPFSRVSDVDPVVLEYDKDSKVLYITVQDSSFGKVRYEFDNKPLMGDFPDVEKIYNDAYSVHDETTTCNAGYVLKACKAILSHKFDKNAQIDIRTSQSEVSPFVIRANGADNDGCEITDEQLLLAIRTQK